MTHFAPESFAKHVLTQDEKGVWRCGAPGSSFYMFRVFTHPGVALIWGDLGEYALRVSDSDSMRWLLTAGSRDYVLGKVTACDGPRKEFMYDDAMARLDEIEHEVRAEFAADILGTAGHEPADDLPPGWDGFLALWDYIGPNVIADAAAVDKEVEDNARVKAARAVRDAMESVEYDGPEAQRIAWWEAWSDEGDSEPYECMSWTSSLLWLWEAIKTFRRLYADLQTATATPPQEATPT